MSRILIAGGSGLIGRQVTKELLSKGHDVLHLSRSPKSNAEVPTYKWDIENQIIDPDALVNIDYVVNLAGAGIADKKWTDSRKKLIIESRVKGNLFFKKMIEEKKLSIKKFISGTAIGYYGERGAEILTENSNPGNTGFLAECCIQWEDSVNTIATTGVPIAILRIGIVLSTKGGALEKMLGPAKFGMGSYFGDGSQIYSWIHIEDISRALVWIVETDTSNGVYNGTAPYPISNKEFMQELMDVKGGFGFLSPVPGFVLNLMLGEMKAVVLTGSHVIPQRLQEEGFEFKFETIDSSLKDLLS